MEEEGEREGGREQKREGRMGKEGSNGRKTQLIFLLLKKFPGAPISSSKWVQTLWSGDRATLTFSHLNKEDEGLYTIRVRMGEYYEQYSAYVFVRGKTQQKAEHPRRFKTRRPSQSIQTWFL